MSNKSNKVHLVSFCSGAYKKIKPVSWKHSTWIHYKKENGDVVRINPLYINYIEEMSEKEKK